MKPSEVVAAFGALAHEHRLAIYRLLIERGPEGLPAGAIAERVGVVPSSLTFHLQILLRAGLVKRRRAGRQLMHAVDFDANEGLVKFFTKRCCVNKSLGADGRRGPAGGPARAIRRSKTAVPT